MTAPTVRARLTLLYGGVFLAAGAAQSAVTYFLISHGSLTPQPRGTPDAAQRAYKQQVIVEMRQSNLHQLLIGSGIALAVTTLVTVVLGWLLARRVLRPLRAITTTTRGISADDLHRRLALPGPRDELTDLGDTIDGLLTRLEAAFAAQRSFVANASHELRTPVTLTRTTLQVALADPAVTLDSLRTACHDAIDAGRHQERLIDALLTLARGQRGLDHGHPVDLAALATTVVAAHQATAAALRIDLAVTADPAPVTGDAPLLERLLSNLVGNALHHNHPGGTVHLRTGTEAHHTRLEITNTGPRIAPDQLTRLLQPFQRTTTDRVAGDHDGLGLGLPIVEAIATAHGARLTLRPRPSGGLTVELAFPPPDTKTPPPARRGRGQPSSTAATP